MITRTREICVSLVFFHSRSLFSITVAFLLVYWIPLILLHSSFFEKLISIKCAKQNTIQTVYALIPFKYDFSLFFSSSYNNIERFKWTASRNFLQLHLIRYIVFPERHSLRPWIFDHPHLGLLTILFCFCGYKDKEKKLRWSFASSLSSVSRTYSSFLITSNSSSKFPRRTRKHKMIVSRKQRDVRRKMAVAGHLRIIHPSFFLVSRAITMMSLAFPPWVILSQ